MSSVITANQKDVDAEINRLKGLEKITLFHGTSCEAVQKILRKGILPWEEAGGHNWDMGGADMFGFYTPRMGQVYLATFEKARHYANCHQGMNYLATGRIVGVDIETANLVPDEDSKKDSWEHSLALVGTCAHKGIVAPNKLIGVYDLYGNLVQEVA